MSSRLITRISAPHARQRRRRVSARGERVTRGDARSRRLQSPLPGAETAEWRSASRVRAAVASQGRLARLRARLPSQSLACKYSAASATPRLLSSVALLASDRILSSSFSVASPAWRARGGGVRAQRGRRGASRGGRGAAAAPAAPLTRDVRAQPSRGAAPMRRTPRNALPCRAFAPRSSAMCEAPLPTRALPSRRSAHAPRERLRRQPAHAASQPRSRRLCSVAHAPPSPGSHQGGGRGARSRRPARCSCGRPTGGGPPCCPASRTTPGRARARKGRGGALDVRMRVTGKPAQPARCRVWRLDVDT